LLSMLSDGASVASADTMLEESNSTLAESDALLQQMRALRAAIEREGSALSDRQRLLEAEDQERRSKLLSFAASLVNEVVQSPSEQGVKTRFAHRDIHRGGAAQSMIAVAAPSTVLPQLDSAENEGMKDPTGDANLPAAPTATSVPIQTNTEVPMQGAKSRFKKPVRTEADPKAATAAPRRRFDRPL